MTMHATPCYFGNDTNRRVSLENNKNPMKCRNRELEYANQKDAMILVMTEV